MTTTDIHKIFFLTVDFENDWHSSATEGIRPCLDFLLNFLPRYQIKATVFVLAELIEKFALEIYEISKIHEVAVHSHSHKVLTNLSTIELLHEIKEAKERFEEINITPYGFSAPFFCTNQIVLDAIKSAGFLYDSSFVSFSIKSFYQNFFHPNRPYKLKNGLWEFPVTNWTFFRIPFGLSYLRIFGSFFDYSKISTHTVLFFMHSYDFAATMTQYNLAEIWKPFYLAAHSSNENRKLISDVFDRYQKKKYRFVSIYDYLNQGDKIG